jgi:hypothetical protein
MRLLIPLFALSLASCSALESGVEEKPVRLLDQNLNEASGLAVSRRDPNLLWLINDSGAAASIHLADTSGQPRGVVHLRGVKNTDWEDLAAFTLDGKPYLLVADIGDNAAQRKELTLYIVAEPEASSSFLKLNTKADWFIRFHYEDGPRDCEGIAVDTPNRRILLLTKRDKQPAIYQLPLDKPSGRKPLIAKRLGPLAKLPLPPKTLPHPFAFQPTGLDISADDKLAAVLTYRGVYLFRRAEKETWAEAFAKAPEILGSHGLSQAEALAFSPDGQTLYVTTEGKNPRLVKMQVPK